MDPRRRWGVYVALVIGGAPAAAATRPAATMQDVQNAFAACLRPPAHAGGARLTFYFSLKRDGTEFGVLRSTLSNFTGAAADRANLLSDLRRQFAACLPLSLTPDLARTIPGKVYFLQLSLAASGAADVLLRPYGSDIPLPYDLYDR